MIVTQHTIQFRKFLDPSLIYTVKLQKISGSTTDLPFLFQVKQSRSFCPSYSMSSRIGTNCSCRLALSWILAGSVSSKLKNQGADNNHYSFLRMQVCKIQTGKKISGTDRKFVILSFCAKYFSTGIYDMMKAI